MGGVLDLVDKSSKIELTRDNVLISLLDFHRDFVAGELILTYMHDVDRLLDPHQSSSSSNVPGKKTVGVVSSI